MSMTAADRYRIWIRRAVAIGLAFALGNGCGMSPRPRVAVAIGMTVEQLKAGSSYPFDDATSLPAGDPPPRMRPGFHNWIITEPYDLVYRYGGQELRADDIGGDNYLLAVSTGPAKQQEVVQHLQITFQNRALTLDEALAAAERLNKWFVAAGFHPLKPGGPEPARIMPPFSVDSRERGAGAPFPRPMLSYADARAAFLDPDARIISMTPFELATDDAVAGLELVNARRWREDTAAPPHEDRLEAERTYFLNLSIARRGPIELPR